MPFTAGLPSGLLEKPSPLLKKIMIGFVLASLFGLAVAMTVAPPSQELLGAEYGTGNLNSASISWLLFSSALVLLMTPGLAFFYGGMIGHKNVIATISAVVICMAIVPIFWSLMSFSLAFGDSAGHPDMIGTPRSYGLMYNVDSSDAGGYPVTTLFIFQGMFAIITPAILVGSIADRVNFPSLMLFVPMWHMAVYCPVAFMVWNGGLINQYGVLDFAGGMVVHMSSGWGALAAAFFMGPRKAEVEGPANVAYTILGAALLWFGWFGFNGGSALAGNEFAAHAFLNTNVATSTAMLAWILLDQLFGKPFKVTGFAMGIVCGLVAITPACGLVNVGAASIIGIMGSICSYCVQVVMVMLGRKIADDSLDVFAAHGVSGTAGMIMTSLFQTSEAGSYIDGAFYGNPSELGKCMIVLLCLVGYYLLATYILMFITNIFISMRVTEEEEEEGLDFSKHYEGPYKGEEDA
mmetsp:Transcript_26725/g.58355  ORF Transcript_26725/g.58355 Transcript_26725/m.58355 type:complete len:464 (-) Transcript_26725:166-1557(-)